MTGRSPAFDCPCLWLSPVVRHFFVGSDVGWLGTDFRGLPVASVHLDRTTIELSVLSGSFSDDELHEICRNLRPVNPEARNQILHTPLATLCYQRRHREPPIAVPVGFWAHERKPESTLTHVFPGAMAPADLPGAILRPRRIMATSLPVFSHMATLRILTRRISFTTDPTGQTFISGSLRLWSILIKRGSIIPLFSTDNLVTARQSPLRARRFTMRSSMKMWALTRWCFKHTTLT